MRKIIGIVGETFLPSLTAKISQVLAEQEIEPVFFPSVEEALLHPSIVHSPYPLIMLNEDIKEGGDLDTNVLIEGVEESFKVIQRPQNNFSLSRYELDLPSDYIPSKDYFFETSKYGFPKDRNKPLKHSLTKGEIEKRRNKNKQARKQRKR